MGEAGNREKGRGYFALILLALLTGCENSEDPVEIPLLCTANLVHGVWVDVVDDLTGEPLSEGTSGRLFDGPYREEMMWIGEATFVGAPERPGVYSVSIFNPRYRTWVASNVVVTADECHVMPIRLTARMVRFDG